MTLTRLDALKYTKVLVVLTPFCDTVCTILRSSAIFVGSNAGFKSTDAGSPRDYRHLPQYYAVYFAAKISRIRFAASEGVLPTFTPAASRASFFA